MRYEFEAELWVWDARRGDTWTFVALPEDASTEIRDAVAGMTRGFGSVRVRASVGAATWSTSIFPDRRLGVFVLPIKRAIRVAAGAEPPDVIRVAIQLVDL